MYTLIVKGARRATIAYHRCESLSDLHELLAVYRSLGYTDDALLVTETVEQEAA